MEQAREGSALAERSRPDLVVIDDDDDTSEILAEALEAHGYRVRRAANGRDGIGLITERPPALILLDLDMPVLDGAGTAARLMTIDHGLELIPVVLASGNVRLTAAAEAIGTPYVIAKPYSLDALLELVAQAARERAAPKPPPEVAR
jgi:CheY-like chemotaxis protein